MSVLIICRGLPGSGKTRWAHARIDAWPRGDVAVISRDTLRRECFGTYFYPDDREFEDRITTIQHAAIAAALGCVSAVVCDDTNLHLDHVAALIEVAQRCRAGWKITDLTSVPLEECIVRDEKRPRGERVGRERITEMFNRHIAEHYPNPLPIP